MAVIRYGRKSTRMKGISAEDVATLQNFWEYEEQCGRRARPQDTFLKTIPPVILEPPAQSGAQQQPSGNQHPANQQRGVKSHNTENGDHNG